MLERLQEMGSEAKPGTPDAVTLLLGHADDNVRVRTLRLLTTSKMTNAPISLPILRHIEPRIGQWFRTGGPHERGETLSIIKRLLIRLRGGSSSLYKTPPSSPSNLKLLEAQKHFVQTLVNCVTDEISPNASYQRHIMGLTVLRHLLESRVDDCDRVPIQQTVGSGTAGTITIVSNRAAENRSNDPDFPFSICLRQSSYAQNLLSLLSDAYEDVRMLSASILRHLLISGPRTSRSENFSEHLQAAMEILVLKLDYQATQTNRSDHADGLGRLYALLHLRRGGMYSALGSPANDGHNVIETLLSGLEGMLNEISTFDKPGSQPLHSLLLGAMHCMTQDGVLKFHGRIIVVCRQVWNAVSVRLCVDSPEITDEDADDLEELIAGPKDMLSYSWRALRDSR